MKNTLIILIAISSSTAALAQQQSSSGVTNHSVSGHQVTHGNSSTPISRGSYTTNTVSPGNGTGIAPYVGTSTSSSNPSDQGQTGYSAGVTIPFGSPPPQSKSSGPAKVSPQ